MNKLPRSGNPFIDAILLALQGIGASGITREGTTIRCEYAGQSYTFTYSNSPAPDSITTCIDALIALGAIPAEPLPAPEAQVEIITLDRAA